MLEKERQACLKILFNQEMKLLVNILQVFCQLTLKSLRQNFKEDMLLFIIAPEKEKAKAEALPVKMMFSKFKKYINSHHSTLTSVPLGW